MPRSGSHSDLQLVLDDWLSAASSKAILTATRAFNKGDALGNLTGLEDDLEQQCEHLEESLSSHDVHSVQNVLLTCENPASLLLLCTL